MEHREEREESQEEARAEDIGIEQREDKGNGKKLR